MWQIWPCPLILLSYHLPHPTSDAGFTPLPAGIFLKCKFSMLFLWQFPSAPKIDSSPSFREAFKPSTFWPLAFKIVQHLSRLHTSYSSDAELIVYSPSPKYFTCPCLWSGLFFFVWKYNPFSFDFSWLTPTYCTSRLSVGIFSLGNLPQFQQGMVSSVFMSAPPSLL